MRESFLEYSAAMIGCYAALSLEKREELHAWERLHVDGSGEYGTSDWPGWIPFIGKFEPESRRGRPKSGIVYLIQERSGLCKIGSTRVLEQRASLTLVWFVGEIVFKIAGGATNIGWRIFYFFVAVSMLNGVRGCWWLRKRDKPGDVVPES